MEVFRRMAALIVLGGVMFDVFSCRPAQPASLAWNLTKTALGTLLLWSVFLLAIPWLLWHAEPELGLDAYRFTSSFWQVTSAVLFGVASLLHLWANYALTVHGEGTPLYLDCPQRLVIAGPYRHVRNPITVALLYQAMGIGLY